MDPRTAELSQNARRAAQKQDWATVHQNAQQIVQSAPAEPEGHFLYGLVEKAAQHPRIAKQAFSKALELDPQRYDAAIELANQLVVAAENDEAITLLKQYEGHLGNSPRYLDMSATLYTTLGLPENAWPLYQKANELQPGIDLFQSNLASCAVYLGKIEEAEEIYKALLQKHPHHQRNHYHLSRLKKAVNDQHINEMLQSLQSTNLSPDRNVFMYYAIAKEYEDLERWSDAFKYYQKGAEAISTVAKYDVNIDIAIINAIIANTPQTETATSAKAEDRHTPIFVLGLPRTGSTLTERIISAHSQVRSIGETQHFETILRTHSGVESRERMTTEMVEALAGKDLSAVAEDYLSAVAHQLEDEPFFLEKLPYNFLYAAHIAKAYPNAKIVYVKRNPLDACFAMYKQVFTWAYKFSYDLDDLARYYEAHVKLLKHWQAELGDRLVVVEYESMVANQEAETRKLLDQLDLPFEEACLRFEENAAASTTASSVQVREKIHSQSVEKWRHFEAQLAPLKEKLNASGIDC